MSEENESEADRVFRQKRLAAMARATGKPGRPFHEVTEETKRVVRELTSNGISQRIIAKALNIDTVTLCRYYRQEMDDAHEQVEAAMGYIIFQAAHRGQWGAAKYWLLTHSKDPRWRTPEPHQVSGDPANPIRIIDMTDVEIQRELDDLAEQRRIASDARGLVPRVPPRPDGVGN